MPRLVKHIPEFRIRLSFGGSLHVYWSRLFRDKTGQGEKDLEEAGSLIISFILSGGPRTTKNGQRVGRMPTCSPTFKKCLIL